jgi:hypothetical protein
VADLVGRFVIVDVVADTREGGVQIQTDGEPAISPTRCCTASSKIGDRIARDLNDTLVHQMLPTVSGAASVCGPEGPLEIVAGRHAVPALR